MHSSGNPVPWDIENGAEHTEYLSMLHVKKGDYAHWALRINRATRRITHVSAGPVIKARLWPWDKTAGNRHVLRDPRKALEVKTLEPLQPLLGCEVRTGDEGTQTKAQPID